MTCMSGGKTVIATSISVRIRDCIGFAFLNCFIGLENSRHPLSKLDAKLKPIATWSLELNLIKKKKLRITALHPSLTYSVHIPAPLPPVIPHTVYIYHKARGKRQLFTFRACLRGGGGPQVSEVTRLTAVEK